MNKWFVIIPLVLSISGKVVWLLLSWSLGALVSRRELMDTEDAERAFKGPAAVGTRGIPETVHVAESRLVLGNSAVSPGHFQRWAAGYKSWFGGELRGLGGSIALARRLAILRMKQRFPDADAYLNCKVETAFVEDPRGRGIICIEVSAAATAVKYEA